MTDQLGEKDGASTPKALFLRARAASHAVVNWEAEALAAWEELESVERELAEAKKRLEREKECWEASERRAIAAESALPSRNSLTPEMIVAGANVDPPCSAGEFIERWRAAVATCSPQAAPDDLIRGLRETHDSVDCSRLRDKGLMYYPEDYESLRRYALQAADLLDGKK